MIGITNKSSQWGFSSFINLQKILDPFTKLFRARVNWDSQTIRKIVVTPGFLLTAVIVVSVIGIGILFMKSKKSGKAGQVSLPEIKQTLAKLLGLTNEQLDNINFSGKNLKIDIPKLNVDQKIKALNYLIAIQNISTVTFHEDRNKLEDQDAGKFIEPTLRMLLSANREERKRIILFFNTAMVAESSGNVPYLTLHFAESDKIVARIRRNGFDVNCLEIISSIFSPPVYTLTVYCLSTNVTYETISELSEKTIKQSIEVKIIYSKEKISVQDQLSLYKQLDLKQFNWMRFVNAEPVPLNQTITALEEALKNTSAAQYHQIISFFVKQHIQNMTPGGWASHQASLVVIKQDTQPNGLPFFSWNFDNPMLKEFTEETNLLMKKANEVISRKIIGEKLKPLKTALTRVPDANITTYPNVSPLTFIVHIDLSDKQLLEVLKYYIQDYNSGPVIISAAGSQTKITTEIEQKLTDWVDTFEGDEKNRRKTVLNAILKNKDPHFTDHLVSIKQQLVSELKYEESDERLNKITFSRNILKIDIPGLTIPQKLNFLKHFIANPNIDAVTFAEGEKETRLPGDQVIDFTKHVLGLPSSKAETDSKAAAERRRIVSYFNDSIDKVGPAAGSPVTLHLSESETILVRVSEYYKNQLLPFLKGNFESFKTNYYSKLHYSFEEVFGSDSNFKFKVAYHKRTNTSYSVDYQLSSFKTFCSGEEKTDWVRFDNAEPITTEQIKKAFEETLCSAKMGDYKQIISFFAKQNIQNKTMKNYASHAASVLVISERGDGTFTWNRSSAILKEFADETDSIVKFANELIAKS